MLTQAVTLASAYVKNELEAKEHIIIRKDTWHLSRDIFMQGNKNIPSENKEKH